MKYRTPAEIIHITISGLRRWLCQSKQRIYRYPIYKNCPRVTADWKSGISTPTAPKLVIVADYLGCSVDYLLGRTDNPTPLNLPKELTEKLCNMTKGFIGENIVTPLFLSNRVYEKDYNKVLTIYDKAKKYKKDIMKKEDFLALMKKYENTLTRVVGANGYSMTPKNYVEFKEVYDVYVESCIYEALKKVK